MVLSAVDYKIIDAHISCGGVSPIPLYLKETSEFLRGQMVNAETIGDANEIMQAEISPISDVRGSAEYRGQLAENILVKFARDHRPAPAATGNGQPVRPVTGGPP